MRWGAPVLTIALLIALVWASGCADVSFGSQKIGDFGSTKEEQKAVGFFKEKYGDPLTNSGPPRFLEPMVTTGLVNNTPVDKVTKFSKETGSIFFWVFYDNFKKGDPLTLTWTFNGKTVITLQREAGGDFGRAFGEFLKPDKGWATGMHTMTISGSGTSATTTFEIIDGVTQTVPLPYEQASGISTAPSGPGGVPVSEKFAPVVAQRASGKPVSVQPAVPADVCVCQPPFYCSERYGTNAHGDPCNCHTCNGQCVDLSADKTNCGSCGNVCPADDNCYNGQCFWDWGRCGTAADCDFTRGSMGDGPREWQCVNTYCNRTCKAGYLSCKWGPFDDVCTDILNDNENCGSCDRSCLYGYACQNGQCKMVN